MRRAVSVFLWGFLLDALLSVAGARAPVHLAHVIVAVAILLYGLALLAASAITPRISKRLLYPPAAFLVWKNICGAFPLGFPEIRFSFEALSWIQLAFAAALLVIDGTAARWQPSLVDRSAKPAFRWRNLLGAGALLVAAACASLFLAAVNALGIAAESGTDGYLKLRPAGLLLEEREFQRGDKRVRLVSMMHIGNQEFYDEILRSIPANGKAAVLMEGVSDDRNLLTERFSYVEVAKMLGLTSQESSTFQRRGAHESKEKPAAAAAPNQVDFLRADVDISTFSPTTIAFMNAIGKFLSHPSAQTLREMFGDPDSPLRQSNASEIVMNDILRSRNAHLLAEIRRGLDTYDLVIVPWGALHLPEIQRTLLSWGFRETSHVARPVIRF